MREIVSFKSSNFVPVLPEESQVNPEVYGAELAYWLCKVLVSRGVVTSYPEYEDWGWYIQYLPDTGSEFDIHCYNVDGAKDQWLLSLRRHARKLFGRDKPSYSETDELLEAIRSALTEAEGVKDIKWLYEQAT